MVEIKVQGNDIILPNFFATTNCVSYPEVHVTFIGDEWSTTLHAGLVKAVIFRRNETDYTAQLDANNKAYVPAEALDAFGALSIGVRGEVLNIEGQATYAISTRYRHCNIFEGALPSAILPIVPVSTTWSEYFDLVKAELAKNVVQRELSEVARAGAEEAEDRVEEILETFQDTVDKAHSHAYYSLLELFNQAKFDEISHANRGVIDTIEQHDIDNWNEAEKNVQADLDETNINSDSYVKGQDKFEPALETVPSAYKEKYFLNALKEWAIASHADLSALNGDNSYLHITLTEKTQFADAYTKRHTHPQTFIADSILQSHVNSWNEAYQDKHQHNNLTGVLDLLASGERGLKFNGTYVTPTLEELGIFLVDEYSDIADKTGLLGITKTHTTPHIPEEFELLSSVTVKPILPTGAKPTGLIKSVTYLLDPDEEGSILAILQIKNGVSNGDYSFPLIIFVDITVGGTANAYGYAYSAVDQTLSLKGLADSESSSMDFVGGQWYSYRVNVLTQYLVSYPVPSDSPPAVYNTALYREEVGNNNCTYKISLEDYFTSTLSTPSVAYYQDPITHIWTAINATSSSGSGNLEFVFESGATWGATLAGNIITFTYPAYATAQDIEDYVASIVPPAETPDVTKFLNEDNEFAKVLHSQLTDDESTKHLTSQERADIDAYVAQNTIYTLPENWTLETNKNYAGVISTNPTFVLPTQQEINPNRVNIIHIYAQIVGTIAVNWGTLVCFSYSAIPPTPAGYCDIEFEWSPNLSKWNVTVKYKGVVS